MTSTIRIISRTSKDDESTSRQRALVAQRYGRLGAWITSETTDDNPTLMRRLSIDAEEGIIFEFPDLLIITRIDDGALVELFTAPQYEPGYQPPQLNPHTETTCARTPDTVSDDLPECEGNLATELAQPEKLKRRSDVRHRVSAIQQQKRLAHEREQIARRHLVTRRRRTTTASSTDTTTNA